MADAKEVVRGEREIGKIPLASIWSACRADVGGGVKSHSRGGVVDKLEGFNAQLDGLLPLQPQQSTCKLARA